MALRSLSLLFLSALVSAQNTTTLGNITTVNVPARNTIKAGDFITFGFSFTESSVGQELRNVTAEFMVGSTEAVHGNDVGSPISNDIGYWLHAATPPGNYHIRINGTVYDALNAFGNDPGKSLGNLGEPLAGSMYYLNNISTVGSINVAVAWIDESFGMTMEVVKSGTLESVGSVVLNSTQQAFQALPVNKFKLVAGAFRIRANFTDKNHAGNFVTLSDEFYVASQGPCAGLQSGNSTTSGGGSSSDAPSATPTGAALSRTAVPFAGLFALFLGLIAGAAAV
ncbi:hypothetical protein B0H14DRAFT_2562625 [Mycena olivaceomarginata]|nr:hypothetical protein B0H14DRAFT_2562625 [Mycena olivaceomarginata]